MPAELADRMMDANQAAIPGYTVADFDACFRNEPDGSISWRKVDAASFVADATVKDPMTGKVVQKQYMIVVPGADYYANQPLTQNPNNPAQFYFPARVAVAQRIIVDGEEADPLSIASELTDLGCHLHSSGLPKDLEPKPDGVPPSAALQAPTPVSAGETASASSAAARDAQ